MGVSECERSCRKEAIPGVSGTCVYTDLWVQSEGSEIEREWERETETDRWERWMRRREALAFIMVRAKFFTHHCCYDWCVCWLRVLANLHPQHINNGIFLPLSYLTSQFPLSYISPIVIILYIFISTHTNPLKTPATCPTALFLSTWYMLRVMEWREQEGLWYRPTYVHTSTRVWERDGIVINCYSVLCMSSLAYQVLLRRWRSLAHTLF